MELFELKTKVFHRAVPCHHKYEE